MTGPFLRRRFLGRAGGGGGGLGFSVAVRAFLENAILRFFFFFFWGGGGSSLE